MPVIIKIIPQMIQAYTADLNASGLLFLLYNRCSGGFLLKNLLSSLNTPLFIALNASIKGIKEIIKKSPPNTIFRIDNIN